MAAKKQTITDAVFASLKNKSNRKKSRNKKKTWSTLDEKIVSGLNIFLESPFK
tara:strand:+ start:61 stop:219 length:159 start_codon:yes stop_codon:yes gene_type:complete